MGCSQTLIEYKDVYNSGEHGYKFNNKWCGIYKDYYRNGVLRNMCICYNGSMSGRLLQWHENGNLYKDTYCYNDYYRKYKKYYDTHGSLIQHTILDDPKNETTYSDELRADYTNDKLCSYSIKRYNKNIYCSSRVIYNTSLEYDFIIDLSIINPIRTIQRVFKQHMYNLILSTLNNVIDINDMSKLIVSYLTKN
jgi:hypothetical protein